GPRRSGPVAGARGAGVSCACRRPRCSGGCVTSGRAGFVAGLPVPATHARSRAWDRPGCRFERTGFAATRRGLDSTGGRMVERMARRGFVKRTALGAAGAGLLGACGNTGAVGGEAGGEGVAGPEITWRVASSFPRGLDIIYGSAET